ncbi:uncharacterized protein LOC135223810 [Macrobrachium nipponense]|uniref:uncharacterized protein LOC135223810 n=1 Tax=Macrobrachium nipponense TaxID=159736 RepID=UPI0030C87CBB
MGALQLLAIAVSALLVLENGLREAEGASYSFTTRLQSSSSNKAPARAAATQPNAVVASGTRNRADYSVTDYRRYLPVEHTPEVKKAREQFFSLYKKQASLAAEAPDNDLDGKMSEARTNVNDDDYYYYDYEGENSEYEEDDDDEEESEGSEEGDEHEDDDEEDSDEESEYSDEADEDSSSSSEEDGVDSSEENGLDSSEEGADSSEESLDGEDSSSSSSSEEDGDGSSSGGFQPLNTNSLAALRPVTDTPEVKKAKRTFFDLYKAQAELSFSAPDDK